MESEAIGDSTAQSKRETQMGSDFQSGNTVLARHGKLSLVPTYRRTQNSINRAAYKRAGLDNPGSTSKNIDINAELGNQEPSNISTLVSYASFFGIPETQILDILRANERRFLLPPEAVDSLKRMGLCSMLFTGDLRDLQKISQPVIALMKSNNYCIVLMVDAKVVVVHLNWSLHPITLKRIDFDCLWTQCWIESYKPAIP